MSDSLLFFFGNTGKPSSQQTFRLIGKAQVLLISLTMTKIYLSVPVSCDH